MEIHELLKELYACKLAQEWASARTWEQIYNECHRGDWLCWLFARTNPEDIQLLTLVKGHQANTVRHLMKDERSLEAVDAAIAFGEGKITIDELNLAAIKAYSTDYASHAAAYAANAAYDADAAYSAAYSADYASHAAAYAADAAAYAAEAANSANAAEAKKQNQKETADIFRKFIKITDFNLC